MKISKEIWIDRNVRWNILRKQRLSQKNFYKGHAYMVCTSPHTQFLFEIIEAGQINHHYERCTVLAVCASRHRAIERVVFLIDQLYNEKSKTYDELLE